MLIIGFVFVSIIGTFLHFAYDISKHNKIVAIFSAVNESTWEHIKIGLTGYFLWCLIDGYICGTNPNYFFAKLIGALLIILLIPLIFYSYQKIVKKSIIWIDILTFYVAIFVAMYISNYFLNIKSINYFCQYLSVIGFILVFGVYILGTFFPVKGILFKDPITKKYGIHAHSDEWKNKKNN